MEAIYWGSSHGWGHGAGTGPWVMADLENGNCPMTSTFTLARVSRIGSLPCAGHVYSIV